MPQVASVSHVSPIDTRPPVSTRRDEPADGFSQLLDAVGNTSEPQDAPQPQSTSPASTRPMRRDHDSVDRFGGHDDDRASQTDSDSRADASPGQGTGARDKPKESDDASSGQDGKSKDHKNRKDAAEADGAASVQTATDKPVTASTEASTVATAVTVPASTDSAGSNAADTASPDLTPAIDGKAPQQPALALPASGTPQSVQGGDQPANAAQPAELPQLPLFAGKAVPKQQAAAQPKGDGQAASPGKNTAATASGADAGLRASLDASPASAAKPAAAAAPKVEPDAAQDAKPAAPDAATSPALQANTKPETPGAAPLSTPAPAADAQDSTLPKHLSAEVHITSDTPITLPNVTQSVQANYTPASVSVQTAPVAADNQPVPLQAAALAVEIASRARDGSRQFDIRLDPPELGRIEVKLDVDKSGQVSTHLTVDRPETLDLLRRDAQGLERALQQAGLKTSDSSLEFSLRQQTPDGSQQGRNQAQSQPNPQAGGTLLADDDQASAVQAGYQWAARMRGGVDIRV